MAESVVSECQDRNNHVDIMAGVIEATSPRSRYAISTRGNSTGDDDPVPGSTATSRVPFLPVDVASTRKSFDKYPPLFFTMRDFQHVMSATWKIGDAGAPSPADPDRNPREEVSTSATMMLDDGDDDVCFRVTTTNLPFERCLERRRSQFDRELDLEFADHRFEDNADGNTRMNDKGSPAHDISDSSEDSNCRTGTRVRFAVEPPSSSARKLGTDVKIGARSGNSRYCESILEEEQAGHVDLVEIQDKHADVKDCGIKSQEKPCTPNNDKGNIAMTGDDSPTSVDARNTSRTHCDNGDSDMNFEESCGGDFNSTSWNERVGKEKHGSGEGKITSETEKPIMEKPEKWANLRQMLHAASEIAGNTYLPTEESSACETEEVNAAETTLNRADLEEVFLEKTSDDIKERSIAKNEEVFISESRDVSNRLDGDNGSDKRVSVDDDLARSLGSEETQRLLIEENKETSGCLNSENKRERIPPSEEETFANSVPVKVRRNSFLETMLSDDSVDCTIIASVTPSSSADKEASIPNELRNEARESNADIAREDGRLRDPNNAVKVENSNVSRDPKETKERIAAVSVKLTQSENKSAGGVKSDVLNELLCNFSSIKLKTVSPEMRKLTRTTDKDENIARPVTIDDAIANGRQDVTFQMQKSRDQTRDVPTSTRTVSTLENNTTTVKEIAREEISTSVEMKSGSPKNDTCDPTCDEELAKYTSTETTTRPRVLSRGANIANFGPKTKMDEESPGVESEVESRAKESIDGTSEGAGSVGEVRGRKSRETRAPRTILKKTGAECERRTGESLKRIPIGAPTTMNKIFDSRELEAMACRPCGSSVLEDGERKRGEASEATHGRGDEQKTDEEVIADDVADVSRRVASRPALALENSGDKCAIARKTTSATPCNNNDNNRAVTPVAVSNDQSPRDVVTITPGKVRSFVKYYEIRGDETTEGRSKVNGSERVAKHKSTRSLERTAPTVGARNSQRPEVMAQRKEAKGAEELVKSPVAQDGLLTSAWRIPQDPRELLVVRKATESGSRVTKERGRNDVSDREQITRTAAKKSVQFLGGCTVIHSTSFDEDESAGIAAQQRATSSRKRKAPGIPSPRDSDGQQGLVREIARSGKLSDAERSSFQRREVAAQVS